MAEEIEIRGWNCKTESILISQWLALWCQEGGEVKEFVKMIINRLQRKKTEIFIERIFTAILQIEKREEKLEWETICLLNYSHCREQKSNLLKYLFPSMTLSLSVKSQLWIKVTIQLFHRWGTEHLSSSETSSAQPVKEGWPSILTEEPTGGRIFGSEFS